jgi:enamine deaminase RidA (YjgF/YER057c/UK114 family)
VNPTRGTKRVGNIVYVSARAPKIGGAAQFVGKVGSEISEEQACQAARIAALNALATLQEGIGDLNRVKQVVKITGYVNSAPGFQNQHQVMNCATQLLIDIFGERGYHARGSFGVAELPLNNALEIEMIVEVED